MGGYKSWKVSSQNGAMETHVANHQRYQKLILWWKETFDGMKPSAKYRVNKVSWRLQMERGTFHVGRWYEAQMALTIVQETQRIGCPTRGHLSPTLNGRSASSTALTT